MSSPASDSTTKNRKAPSESLSPRLALSPRHAVDFDLILAIDRSQTVVQAIESLIDIDSEKIHADRKKLSQQQSQVITRLAHVGIIVKEILQTHDEEGHIQDVYYGLTADDDMMKRQAERMQLDLKLKPEYGGGFAPFEISKEHLFESYQPRFFAESNRFRILQHLISARPRSGGAGLNVTRLIDKDIIKQIFPLHNKEEVKELTSMWVWRFWTLQPIERVRAYFGEKLALYFVWLGWYNMWLAVASIVGLIVFAASLAKGYNNYGSIIYSVFISFWATLSYEFWKRKQAATAANWNMVDFERDENELASYHGDQRVGVFVDGVFVDLADRADDPRFSTKRVEYFSAFSRSLRTWLIISPLILILNAVALLATFGLLLAQSYLSEKVPVAGSFLGGAANAIGILILEAIYIKIAYKLTSWQNWRTQTEFEDNLILQRFIFEFVVAYAALFYIAFVKPRLAGWGIHPFSKPPCSPMDQKCIMGELEYNLGFTFIIRILVLQSIEVLLPIIRAKISACCSLRKSGRTKLSWVEENSMLGSYNGTLPEYEEIVLQFGYVTLFAASFPLAPLAALLNNLVEIRSDAYRFLNGTQRPLWQGAKDIGPYAPILQFMSFAAVITNCALIAFTTSDFDQANSLILFLALENAVFFINYIISLAIPDVPAAVRRREAKTKFLTQELAGIDLNLNEQWEDIQVHQEPVSSHDV